MAEKLTTTFLVDRTRAAWTTLRDKKGGDEVVEQVETPLEVPAEADLHGPEFAAQLKSRCSRVRGEITLVLDTEEVQLRAGDTVVQRGTNHAWSNRSTRPAAVAISSHDGIN